MICDISKYQGTINWDKLAPELDFIILRSSVGTNTDSRYKEYAAACKARHVPFHAYHYLKATTATEARTEAKIMANATEGTAPLFYVIDAEYSGIPATVAHDVCEAFEDGLRHYISKDVRVAVYIANHLYTAWDLDYSRYAYVWIPRYGTNTGEPQTPPVYPCDLWQYTSAGKAPGINGNVDLDKLTGTKPMSFFTAPIITETEDGDSVFTSKQLVNFCEEVFAAKWVYWYGTYGRKCSQSLYESKKKQYPSHYGSSRTAGYMRDIAEGRWCADCVGMIKGFFWKGGNLTATPVYKSNNCPDVSANGMFKLCTETGNISSIPEIPGLVVWKDGHIGVYVGNGYTIEMKGFDYDCRKNKVTSGPWTKWGKLPNSMITYTNVPEEEPNVNPVEPDALMNGSKGEAVRELQEDLLALGYRLPKYGADGDFGSETKAAVESFQSDHNLPVNGIADAVTLAAIETALEDDKESQPVIQYVKITGGSVNVRSGPGTSNTRILGVAHKDDKLPYQGEEKKVDGRPWYLVEYKGENAWVSSKYSKVVDA